MALLEISGLGVVFGGLAALTAVSLQVEAGTVCALIGPNGAGKTTLFNAVSGYVRPSSGAVRMEAQAITGLPPHAVARRGICRTFQNGGVFGSMTVLENVLTGLHQTTPSSVVGTLFGLPRDRAAEREATERARAALAPMGLAPLADRRAKELSFGQQRMVEITRALIARPRLLLLDEPAVGLSAGERDALAIALRALAADGIAVLLVEHVIDLVMAVSDRIFVLNHGELLASGPPAEIRANPAVLEAYLGAT
ncbi:MAG: ABC transporter ATP-binding protein [Acetobacteraceae bacterium]